MMQKNACEHTSDEGVIRVQLERTEAAFFCIIVVFAGWDSGGGGNYVSIDHLDNYKSQYMHLDSIVVKKGDKVTIGQLIGYKRKRTTMQTTTMLLLKLKQSSLMKHTSTASSQRTLSSPLKATSPKMNLQHTLTVALQSSRTTSSQTSVTMTTILKAK